MARFKNDPLGGTVNYAEYASWPPVVDPTTGGILGYQVPGYPQYIFDPVASNASGDKVLRRNPQAAINQQQEQQKAQKKAQDLQEQQSSPAGQLLPVVGTVGGMLAANELMSAGIGKAPATVTQVLENGTMIFSDGTVKNAAGQVLSSSAPAVTTQAGAATQGALGAPPPAPTGVSAKVIETNTLPPGSKVAQDGSIVDSQTGQTIGRVVQGAAGAYQIYQGLQEFKNDKIGGGLGIASGGANVGAALGSETAGSFAGPLMAAKGGYSMAKSLGHGGEGIRGAGTEFGAGIGTMVAPGIGTAVGAAYGNILGYGLQGSGIKNKLALAATAPVLLIPGLKDKLIHKTVAQTQNERLSRLQKDKIIGIPDTLGQFGKSKAELVEEAKKSGGNVKFAESRLESDLTANDTIGGLHNFELVGNDYMGKWNDAQRKQFQELNLAAGNIREKKGGLYFNDKEKALKFKEQIDKGGIVPTTQSQAATQGAISAKTPVVNPPIPRPNFVRR